MVDMKILRRAILVGVVFELILVMTGHFKPWFRPTFFLFGCMLIAGVAGLLYARDLARGYGAGALAARRRARSAASPRWRYPTCWGTGRTFSFPGACCCQP